MIKNKSILFVGQAFYNSWYLSRELRKLGWKADLINIDTNPDFQKLYHGEDMSFSYTPDDLKFRVDTLLNAFDKYQIFHFANKGGIFFVSDYPEAGSARFVFPLVDLFLKFFLKRKSLNQIFKLLCDLRLIKDNNGNFITTRLGLWAYRKIFSRWLFSKFGSYWDIQLLKLAGKKIGYTNNGCLDGVLKTSFSQWGPINTCKTLCKYYTDSNVCSDHLNSEWGKLRNMFADYQCLLGGNRADYNISSTIFESPWIYCLDTEFWNPELLVPTNYVLPFNSDVVKIYHAVGSFESRSGPSNVNIKCTHIYLDLVAKFKREGLPVELIFFHSIPNKIIRYYQVQADIVVDMLTFGFFGANIREAMMLGKPAVCYIRPEWIEMMRAEIPDYADELPIISATPETVEEILRELINNKSKREEIGRRSREFAVKWHSSETAAKYFDKFLPLIISNNAGMKEVFNIQKEIYN
jgi:glycosyltransferase involved in cell wall biosynthesis